MVSVCRVISVHRVSASCSFLSWASSERPEQTGPSAFLLTCTCARWVHPGTCRFQGNLLGPLPGPLWMPAGPTLRFSAGKAPGPGCYNYQTPHCAPASLFSFPDFLPLTSTLSLSLHLLTCFLPSPSRSCRNPCICFSSLYN